MRETHKKFQKEVNEKKAELGERRRIGENLPKLAERNRLTDQIKNAEHIPDLSDSFDEQRKNCLHELNNSRRDQSTNKTQLDTLSKKLAELQVEKVFLSVKR